MFYVANQFRHGVSIIDPISLTEIGFLPTGRGAHGMAISRDTRSLYVTNRLAGTISRHRLRDEDHRGHVGDWRSPDMLQVSPDGTQLWTANRYANTVVVVDAGSGQVLHCVQVGRQPHGLTPSPRPAPSALDPRGGRGAPPDGRGERGTFLPFRAGPKAVTLPACRSCRPIQLIVLLTLGGLILGTMAYVRILRRRHRDRRLTARPMPSSSAAWSG